MATLPSFSSQTHSWLFNFFFLFHSYILQQGWIDKEAQTAVLPTYDEILETEDAEAVEKADQFERQHNFRFEEPHGADIQTFPRDLENTLRRKNTKRKEERERRKERKTEEKQKKIEDIKRLKNLKKEDILSKLKTISAMSGRKLQQLERFVDLDKEFHPDDFDKDMGHIFNDEYYDHHHDDDRKKPKFDHHPMIDDDTIDACPHPKNKASTTTNSSEQQHIQRDIDDYHQLGYEDILGDMPTRFKYKKVTCTSYGLTAKDILMADDTHLNAYISIKKLAPYRSAEQEQHNLCKYTHSKRLQKLLYETIRPTTTTLTPPPSSSISQARFDSYKVNKKTKKSV
jgi:protein KRI1